MFKSKIKINIVTLLILAFEITTLGNKTTAKQTQTVFKRNQILLQKKKYAMAEKLLKEFLKDKSLSPTTRRKALNTLAGQILWGKPDEAKLYLEQATTLPSNDATSKARTKLLLGYVYKIKKQPHNSLEIWLSITEEKDKIHPALLSSVSHQIGIAYQKINDFNNARKYFKKAIHYGKKVKYKYNYSASETALQRLEKLAKGKK